MVFETYQVRTAKRLLVVIQTIKSSRFGPLGAIRADCTVARLHPQESIAKGNGSYSSLRSLT